MKSRPRILALLAVALTVAALPLRGDRRRATITVRMIGDGKGFRFAPASITAHAGDVVRFVNVSGGPHNVSFWADSIPAGSAVTLQKNMGDTSEPLSGPLISDPNASYTVSLAGLRAGTYKFYCLPHLPMNMTGRIKIRAP